jgi:transitional endoplasmic reticulum ATPase
MTSGAPSTSTVSDAIQPAPVEAAAWDALAGMTALKQLVERRVLLPLSEQRRAEKYGVTPVGAMLLFGPPGTGKTALSRAIAGRLGWAFVEVDLSTVAIDSVRLRHLFERLFQLEEVVIAFDEFEHLGLKRDGHTTPVEPLTAEFLRGLPALAERGRALAVCTTNYIRMLDPALLRPGRFDLVAPVGLPDAEDRTALLTLFLAHRHCTAIDLEAVAKQCGGLSTADLAAVCQRAALHAFEREVQTERDSSIEVADLLHVLDTYRASVTREEIAAFEEDVARFARC